MYSEEDIFVKQSMSLEKVPNARELGGYVMKDGRRIRKKMLLRTGSLGKATQDDILRLKNVYKVRYIFDYRTSPEQKALPDKEIPGAFNISLPCIDPNNNPISRTEYSRHAGRPGFEDFLVEYSFSDEAKIIAREMYNSLIMSEYSQLQFGTFLNYAARQEEGALLWHCSQGKDRTGFASAFILFALGADVKLVVDDFDASNQIYAGLINELSHRIIEKGGSDPELNVVNSLIGVNTKCFIQGLELINREFGSMDEYLHNQLCISDEDILNIQNRFLE